MPDTKKTRTDVHVIDFSQFAGLIIAGDYPLIRIEKHLDSLQKDVHHLTTGFHKLRVITQGKEESVTVSEEFQKQPMSLSSDAN